MYWQKSDFGFWLKLDAGDDVLTNLLSFVTQHSIQQAMISGIGAFSQVELGYFDVRQKRYIYQTFSENLEVLSLTGNLAITQENNPLFHLHVTLGRADYSTLGGHFVQAVVNPTLELAFITGNHKLCRKIDTKFGLNLLDLKDKGV